MFTLDVKALATNIAFMKRATGHSVAKARSMPELDYFRLEVADNVATIGYADWETAVTVRMVAEGDNAEQFVVRVSDLATAVKSLGKGIGSCTVADGKLTIVAEGMTVTVELLTTDEKLERLPDMPERVEDAPALVTSGEEFARMTSVAATAIGTDDTLPMLTGIKLESSNGTVEAATTDRFKLAVVDVATSAIANDLEVLLQGRAVLAVGKAAAKHECVSVTVSGTGRVDALGSAGSRAVQIDTDNATIQFREFDAQFPKFRQLLPNPDTLKTGFTVDGKDFAARIKALSGGKGYVTLSIDPDTGVTVDWYNRFSEEIGGSFTASVGDIRTDEGMPERIRFDAGYLVGILAAVPKGEKVTFGMSIPSRPAVWSWDRSRVLQMPVRIPG